MTHIVQNKELSAAYYQGMFSAQPCIGQLSSHTFTPLKNDTFTTQYQAGCKAPFAAFIRLIQSIFAFIFPCCCTNSHKGSSSRLREMNSVVLPPPRPSLSNVRPLSTTVPNGTSTDQHLSIHNIVDPNALSQGTTSVVPAPIEPPQNRDIPEDPSITTQTTNISGEEVPGRTAPPTPRTLPPTPTRTLGSIQVPSRTAITPDGQSEILTVRSTLRHVLRPDLPPPQQDQQPQVIADIAQSAAPFIALAQANVPNSEDNDNTVDRDDAEWDADTQDSDHIRIGVQSTVPVPVLLPITLAASNDEDPQDARPGTIARTYSDVFNRSVPQGIQIASEDRNVVADRLAAIRAGAMGNSVGGDEDVESDDDDDDVDFN